MLYNIDISKNALSNLAEAEKNINGIHSDEVKNDSRYKICSIQSWSRSYEVKHYIGSISCVYYSNMRGYFHIIIHTSNNQEDIKMKFCGKCGAELVEGDVFCIHCGARIADYNVDDAANQTASNEADGNPINEQNIGSQQNQQTQGQTYAPGYQSAPVQNSGGYYSNGAQQPFSQQCQGNYSHQGQQFYGQQNTQAAVEPEMSLFDYFVKCLKHYADFKGRARRKEYWGFALFLSLFYIGGFIVALFIDAILELPIFTILVYISTLVFIIPSIAVTVRRLHDIGKSGGWYFVSFVPLIGGIWLFVLTVLEGEPRSNMYGPPTKRFTYYG